MRKSKIQKSTTAVIYCVAADDGTKYGVFAVSSGNFTRDELVHMHLEAIEEADGDTVDRIYVLPDSGYTDAQLQHIANTEPPISAKLIYSRQAPALNARGHRPAKSKCLNVDALLKRIEAERAALSPESFAPHNLMRRKVPW